jgi:hypothetical protein
METLGALIPLSVLAVPISALVRLIAAGFSKRVRNSIALHPVAHLIWFGAGIAIVVLVLLLPPLKHPRLKKGASFTTPEHALSLGRWRRCFAS